MTLKLGLEPLLIVDGVYQCVSVNSYIVLNTYLMTFSNFRLLSLFYGRGAVLLIITSCLQYKQISLKGSNQQCWLLLYFVLVQHKVQKKLLQQRFFKTDPKFIQEIDILCSLTWLIKYSRILHSYNFLFRYLLVIM